MFSSPEPVTFLEAGPVVDPYSGETVKTDWGNPVTVLEDVCGVAPAGSTEALVDYGQPVDWDYDLIFDHEVSVSRLWRVRVRGEVLAVSGRPAVWRSPMTGWSAGTVVRAGGVGA